jgi:hypothetical protein
VSYESLDCLATLWRFQGHGGISFCGSYAICGMPLLETAVSSAVQISSSLGSSCPWEHRLTPATGRQPGTGFSPLSLPPPPSDTSTVARTLAVIFAIIILAIVLMRALL